MRLSVLLFLGTLSLLALLTACQIAASSGQIKSFSQIGSLDLGSTAGAFGTISDLDASSDGLTLVLTGVDFEGIGLVDISDPANPTSLDPLLLSGIPRAVKVTPDGLHALVIDGAGLLAVNLSSGMVARTMTRAEIIYHERQLYSMAESQIIPLFLMDFGWRGEV